ncbi:MAG: aminotransferase class I/II-fold pyridoxal phosphate-dependent enzyme, partial [Chloroflexi bacterium]|nr:aminotransferase class I/II-fold pyridoxal phosphate-dependent enzyme [Chloroflexota bacterium]
DVAGVEAAVRAEPRAKVLFLCAPNNPDGSTISDADLRRLLALPVLVVLDEAYVEFAGSPGRIGWVQQYDNLAVLRTFSKWAGLAGLRVGYGAFPEWLLPELWKIKQPYNLNAVASAAAIASLEDVEVLRANVLRITAERERLFAALQAVPYLHPYPSQANFILCRVVGRDARELKQTLEAQGILVRYFDQPGLRDCVRISVGRPEDTNRLLAALFTTKGTKDTKGLKKYNFPVSDPKGLEDP